MLEQALQLAQLQGALAWELHAAMSIVRLRQRQGQGYTEELVKARAGLHSVSRAIYRGVCLPRPGGGCGVDRT